MLFILSINLRYLRRLSQQHIIHRFPKFPSIKGGVRYNSRQFLHKEVKGLQVSDKSNKIKIPLQIKNILKINHKSIAGLDIVNAMKSLVFIYKQKHVQSNLYNEVFYKQLCSLVMANIYKLSIRDALEVLSTLIKIDVPSTSKIIINILKHINGLLDGAPITCYNTYSLLLSKLIPNSMTSEAVAILNQRFLREFLKQDINKNENEFFVHALVYVTHNLNNPRITKTIYKYLENYDLKNASTLTVLTLTNALFSIKYFPSSLFPLLLRVQEFLINNANDLKINEIEFILLRTVHMHQKRIEGFYNKTLLDEFAKRILVSDATLYQTYQCLDYYLKLKHIHKELIVHAATLFYEAKWVLCVKIRLEKEILFTLVQALAYSNYKPVFWNKILNYLMNVNFTGFENQSLLLYSLHLSSLGHYDVRVLDKIFKTNFKISSNTFYNWLYLKLWQKLKVMPNYDGPMPPNNCVKMFDQLLESSSSNSPLLPSLERGVGGSMYIKSNLRTRLHHHIDHIVAFRSGGFPVAINDYTTENVNDQHYDSKVEYIEDIKIPSNCQIVAVVYIPYKSWYAKNTQKMLTPFSMYIESLEALSLKVVAISKFSWDQLTDNAKIPYLMNEIRSKIEFDSNCF